MNGEDVPWRRMALLGIAVWWLVCTGDAQVMLDPTKVETPGGSARVVYITGRVLIDDGSVPPVAVNIERVCHTKVRREGRTDSKGNFSLQLGLSAGPAQDATSGHGEMGPAAAETYATRPAISPELMNCELRADLPGYRSDIIRLATRRLFDHPDAGIIFLHPMERAEGTSISVTSLAAPPDAKKALEHARRELARDHVEQAAEDCRQALLRYPKYAEALEQLGGIYVRQNRTSEAQKSFENAIALDSRFLPPYLSLAELAARNQDWARAASLTDQLLALNPHEYPRAYYLNAVANWKLGNLDRAEQRARAGRKLDTQYGTPNLDVALALVLLQRNDLKGAAEQLNSYLQHVPAGPDADRARRQLAKIQSTSVVAATEPDHGESHDSLNHDTGAADSRH